MGNPKGPLFFPPPRLCRGKGRLFFPGFGVGGPTAPGAPSEGDGGGGGVSKKGGGDKRDFAPPQSGNRWAFSFFKKQTQPRQSENWPQNSASGCGGGSGLIPHPALPAPTGGIGSCQGRSPGAAQPPNTIIKETPRPAEYPPVIPDRNMMTPRQVAAAQNHRSELRGDHPGCPPKSRHTRGQLGVVPARARKQ
ncbi:MAG: hypothetical protein CM15mP74_05520 [Halieaceae bacterium]|nr:MAG: hypothetical protein CM15mP74_05520 [Halieaceae bacterium]